MSAAANITVTLYQRSTDRTIIFIFILTFIIPSYLCYLFIFYSCTHMQLLRTNPQNRVLLILLIVFFIQAVFDIPCRLYYLYNGTVPISNDSFCKIWYLITITTNIIGLHLMALVSIERYLLIFHHTFFIRHHFFISTIPMIISIIYPIIWYVTVIYSMSWYTYQPNYTVIQCAIPYSLVTSKLYLAFIIFLHHLIPIFIVTSANVYIVTAVMYQKAKMRRNNSWRKNLRMTSQLLTVAAFYLAVWLPHCILASLPLFLNGTAKSQSVSLKIEIFENIFPIFVCICPFITLIGFSQLHNKIKQSIQNIQQFFCRHHRNLVAVLPSAITN